MLILRGLGEFCEGFIVYVDESGDHNLDNINSKYPIFVLAFCIFNKRGELHSPKNQHFITGQM
ncbi:DUF3800 domain-containing protein [Moraxella lacunata]|uniref:DUF3800 domain-containing protein n=1 Tax=Moraxella lacunata TaxID=477 RepID=UPI001D179619|nr:DUF3800 domain-containing protein [Moraxella lacunata]